MRNQATKDRARGAVREDFVLTPYDSHWPRIFHREARHLRSCVPASLIGRIEHFGSTAVPGLAAKPIVDMLVEVSSLRAARAKIAHAKEAAAKGDFE
jgi:GrpB-like predicted nucleotidyltransferase (UPF0157 family)